MSKNYSTTTTEILTVETSTGYADATETLTVATVTTTSLFEAIPTMKKRTLSTSATVSCPTLASKNLVHHPASRLSQACSCLGVEAETVTVTVSSTVPATTTTLTATNVQTEVVSATSVVTATTVDISVVKTTATTSVGVARIMDPLTARTNVSHHQQTTTVLATAVAVVYPNCDGNHWAQTFSSSSIFNGVLTPVQNLAMHNLVDCCNSCQETLNCIGGSFTANVCLLRIKKYLSVGTTMNNMCPLAVIVPFPISGTLPLGSDEAVFKGPCHP